MHCSSKASSDCEEVHIDSEQMLQALQSHYDEIMSEVCRMHPPFIGARRICVKVRVWHEVVDECSL